MSPRHPETGLPFVAQLCHFCGNEADNYHDVKTGVRIFHHICYLEYSGAGVDTDNDDYEIED